MPGTLGSIVGIFIGLVILYFCTIKVFSVILIVLIIISLYSIYIYQIKVGKNDKSEIIIDEVVGQLLVMPFIHLNYIEVILAFILFRFFDIFKFFPANIIDKRYSNYFGVLFDDIIAASQAILLIYLFEITYDRFF
jgi:phosphatidylglycerophosphatase A